MAEQKKSKKKTPVKKTVSAKPGTVKKATKKPAAAKAAPKKTVKKPQAKQAKTGTTARSTARTKKKVAPKTKPPKQEQYSKSRDPKFKDESTGSGQAKTGKSADWTKDIFDRFKKGLDEAYDAGMKLADKVGETAQEYTEKYKLQMEIRRTKSRVKEQLLKIGEKVYKLYPTLGQATKVAKDEEISMLYSEIQNLEKKLSDLNIQLNNLDTD